MKAGSSSSSRPLEGKCRAGKRHARPAGEIASGFVWWRCGRIHAAQAALVPPADVSPGAGDGPYRLAGEAGSGQDHRIAAAAGVMASRASVSTLARREQSYPTPRNHQRDHVHVVGGCGLGCAVVRSGRPQGDPETQGSSSRQCHPCPSALVFVLGHSRAEP